MTRAYIYRNGTRSRKSIPLEELAAIFSSGQKRCTTCGETKQLIEFHRSKQNRTGHISACKVCSAARFMEWKHRNWERALRTYRVGHYINTYGMSREESEAMVNNRHGICPICKAHKRLVIDHNHVSGKIRDKICASCNTLIGCSKERKEILVAIIEYLEKHYG